MGLLFDKKTDAGRSARDFAPADFLPKEDLRNLGREAGLVRPEARREFHELMTQAQSNGFTRQEVKESLQALVDKRLTSRSYARKAGARLGLAGKHLHLEDRRAASTVTRSERNMPSRPSGLGNMSKRPSSTAAHSTSGHLY